MYSLGCFVEDKRPFSEVKWGIRTAIYVKLANKLSEKQWTGIYGGLEAADDMQERMKTYGRPVRNWTDNPDEYEIVSSDAE